MTTLVRAVALSFTTALTSVLVAPSAAAAPSCVAQSVQAEHQLYTAAWGHDVIAFLASHPEVLEEFGFDNFGDLASYAARQDHANCPLTSSQRIGCIPDRPSAIRRCSSAPSRSTRPRYTAACGT